MQTLADLHQNYVVLPIDKVIQNVAIIGKIFYASTLTKELDIAISNSIDNKNYEMINTANTNDIMDNHSRSLNRYRLRLNGAEKKCLLHIYWLLKLHENPAKTRFITVAPKHSLKSFSKSGKAVFKILFQQIEN